MESFANSISLQQVRRLRIQDKPSWNPLYIGIHLGNDKYKTILDRLKLAYSLGANILQIYCGNKTLTTLSQKYILKQGEAQKIKLYLKTYNMKIVFHAILTLNYCRDPNHPRNKWGLDNLIYDMNLCNSIGGIGCVIHMGRNKSPSINITHEECIKNYVNSLKIVLDKTHKIPVILETPVYSENIVGGYLESFAKLYNSIPILYKKRVKICIDTCHIFSSGYDIRTIDSIDNYFNKFNKLIGIKNIILIHLNDSKTELNSGIDRHAPIGEGHIFSKIPSNKGNIISYLLDIFLKNNISIVLETDYENFKKELKFIKSLITNQKKINGGYKQKNIKSKLIKIFNAILKYYETLSQHENKTIVYRIESYKKAIKAIENYDGPIYSSKEVKDLSDIGKGFIEKIDIITNTGSLSLYNNIKHNTTINSLQTFMTIWGVGPEAAKKIINKNLYTIKQLKNAVKNKKIKLTEQQELGLKYYDDLHIMITKSQITAYTKIIKNLINKEIGKEFKNPEIDKNLNTAGPTRACSDEEPLDSGETKEWIILEIHNAGSYRMGKKFTSDIDLIITYNKLEFMSEDETKKIVCKFFYETLKKNNIIYETLSSGSDKSIYIIKFEDIDNIYHQMDVAFVKKSQLPWYFLYFGSSKDYSKKIRTIASSQGYKLNEKGLYDKKTGKRINFNPKTEKEIFDFLKIEYILPKLR
jgi:apurinic endonuclease APN1